MTNTSVHDQQAEEKDLEQTIFEIAEHQRDEDYYSLYSLLRERTVYLPIDGDSLSPSAKTGERHATTANEGLNARLVQIDQCEEPFLLATTNSENQSLKDAYVEIEWIEFLKMASQLPDLGGIMLQGEKSWVAFDSARVSFILEWYERITDPGLGIPLLPIVFVGIAFLTYFFGWIVIGGVVALAVAMTVGTIVYDKIKGKTS
ncbi:MAG: hypothetical protein KDD64_01820 [Bdellovibrionales bacterium]|nr:hypothetical protein [Bdellovibrionales bacterium]